MTLGVGIEVGATAVRAAVLEQGGSSLRLVAWGEVPCDTTSPQALTQSLIHLRRSLHVRQAVTLGMPTTSVLLATVEPLVVNSRRASLAVQFELQQHLPFEVNETLWHYQWLNGSALRASGAREEVRRAFVAAVKRSRLEERLASCRRAGLSVRAVGINPLAAVNVWQQELGKDAPSSALFLHLNEQHAEWVIWSPSRLQILPIAAPFDPATPDVPLQYLTGSFEALQASLRELPDPPASCWLLGGSTNRPDLEERVASMLQIFVTRFQLGQLVQMDPVHLESPERGVVAMGLALQDLGRARVTINLLAEVQQGVKAQLIRGVALAVGGLCALLAAFTALGSMVEIHQRHAHVFALLNQREQTYQKLRPEVHALLKQQASVEQRSRQLESLVTDRTLLAGLLGTVSQAMPDDVWLSRVEISKHQQLVEGVLDGRAKSFQSVTQFMDQLKTRANMTTVKPLSTNVETDPANGKEVVVFSILMQRAVHASAPLAK